MVFVCLLVYFVSGVILCVCLVCMNLNINYSTSNKPESQQLQSTWHSLTKDHLLTVLYLALLENKGTLTRLVIETYCTVLPARACITVVLCTT